MTTQKRGSAAFAVCGSFCTLETALEAARMLTLQGWDLLPVMSFAAGQDTRFGTGTFWKERLEALTGHPVLVGISTNDGLGASGENIARLFQRKHYYFVPYGQDDPIAKPSSLKADFARLPAALDAALAGRQLQPVLLQNNV